MATLQDMVQPVVKLLGNRSDVAALAIQEIANTVIELSNDYPFEELRETGPTVQFIPNQNAYAPAYFMQADRAFNKVISWWLYLYTPTQPVVNGSNSGYNLVFRDVEDLEVLFNVPTLPTFWSQLGQDVLYAAATPNQAYYTYVRYQFLHPVTSPVALGADTLLLPQNWWDIIQYSAAERIALQLRMSDVATRYHNILFGDPEFQRSSGGRGQPGLIHRRISQTQKNQGRSTRSIKMVRGSY